MIFSPSICISSACYEKSDDKIIRSPATTIADESKIEESDEDVFDFFSRFTTLEDIDFDGKSSFPSDGSSLSVIPNSNHSTLSTSVWSTAQKPPPAHKQVNFSNSLANCNVEFRTPTTFANTYSPHEFTQQSSTSIRQDVFINQNPQQQKKSKRAAKKSKREKRSPYCVDNQEQTLSDGLQVYNDNPKASADSKPRNHKPIKPLAPLRMPTFNGCSAYYRPYITRDVLLSHHPLFGEPPFQKSPKRTDMDVTSLLSFRMARALAAARKPSESINGF